jgi:hypothetical protein
MAHRTGLDLQMLSRVLGDITATLGRKLYSLGRDLDAERSAVPMAVKFSVPFMESLGEVFPEVPDKSEPPIGRTTFRLLYVDIPVADDIAPGGPQ